MRIFALICLAMTAFAANSVLNRLGVAGEGMDPFTFAAIRVVSGAAALALLIGVRNRGLRVLAQVNVVGAVALTAYLIGFSYAYLALDAGIGALILFGGVQITIFLAVLLRNDPIGWSRYAGAAIALVGLIVLLAPNGSGGVGPITAILAMALAAMGWGVYTLTGQGAKDPLLRTGQNFLLASVLVLPLTFLLGGGGQITQEGVMAAVLSGVVMSAMGYAIWYAVLPHIKPTLAGITQLSVPVIAAVGGAVLLSEPLTLRFAIAAGLVLGGIALSMIKPE